ncbi:phage holin family protein [Aedoeadaptatus acetigenes]|uniref:Phage holin family protein n=1 Tax=Aedoeadaptatus acetigenes TaxID=2981723 RepID=A0ABV1J7E8_9FIRM
MYTLLAFVIADYITGVLRAGVERKLSSAIGFKGIAKKIMIFIVVRIANLCDVNLIKGDGTMIRTAIIFFYIANEGLSIVQARILSPNHSGRRNQKITKIAIHHATGVINGRNIAGVFVPRSRRASAYYNLGSDGVIVLGVDESNRAWTTSSSWCDNRAVTIEVGNSTRGPQWLVSDYILNRLIDLVTDICRRNGIHPCTYTGGKDGVLQKHEWYKNTNCPGPYLGSKFPYIASEVNKRLRGDKIVSNPTSGLYRVRKSWSDVKSQKGAFKNLENAKRCANRFGLKVFDSNGKIVHPVGKIIEELAREVISGKWGNGEERKRRLTNAGYEYKEVQRRVNQLL